MDHSLDDPLNLDSAMGVDFEPHGDQVVSQGDISLDASSHETSIPMEFEPIDEQPLLGTENEQIIGYSDDQFSLQQYVQQQEEDMGANTTVVTSEPSISQSQSDTMIDLQFDPQSFASSPVKQEPQVLPKIISVKAAIPPRFTAIKNTSATSMPRQVAIAPKPARAGALKPLTLAPAPRAALVKKLAVAGAPPAAGKTVLAQIGKQLVMVPAGSGQKIKLVAAGAPGVHYIRTNSDQAQLIATKSISGGSKPMLTKFIVQGQASSEAGSQPAVITKLMGAPAPTRYVTMTQKTVPIPMPTKVLISSPSNKTVRITKKHPFIEIKSPSPKAISTVQTGGTKKVVITAAPAQNVVCKNAGAVKNVQQVNKEGNITIQSTGQRTQLHQINIPGKGIQYIRLVTNSSAPRLKQVPRPVPGPGKTIVLTDAKGHVIQMGADKVQTGGPPPLVISGTNSTVKPGARPPAPQQKLVRIAPVGSKPAIAAALQQSMARSAQSLLAPRAASPAEDKAALRALLASAAEPSPPAAPAAPAADPDCEPRQSSEERSSPRSAEPDPERYREALDQPLIVVSDYLKPREPTEEETQRYNNFEAQSFNSYQAPTTPQALSESELVPSELGLRPRKACNCTKSQCLKLYCDCFANGEFCNRCNCNNCHNNLENEELRQKAIRGCLDRNPNAFRPKIGKAKSGGPEIVRRHNKGCNCKRSGCLKNYCECYEAKIACTAMCKCVGCRNVEETLDRRRRDARDPRDLVFRPPALPHINFMTTEVIEAVCQCLVAAAAEPGAGGVDPVRDVLDEFSRCLQDIINAAHHSAPVLDETRA